MEAIEVAWAFEEIATLLELKGDNPHRIRAYRRAARTLKQAGAEIHTLWQTGKLQSLPGIGKDLAAKIEELLATGSSSYLEDLRAQVPPGLLTLLALPEVGPKTIHTCYTHLGISSLAELEAKARQRELRKLPGLGSKTELKIMKGINLLRSQLGRMPLGIAWGLGEEIRQNLALLPETKMCSLTGSLRRRCDMVGRY
ncbi:MAG: helix-hairpin-helix domain-containing protein [bacterium]